MIKKLNVICSLPEIVNVINGWSARHTWFGNKLRDIFPEDGSVKAKHVLIKISCI